MNDLFEQMKYTEGVEIFNLVYQYLDSLYLKLRSSVAYLCNTTVKTKKVVVSKDLLGNFLENKTEFMSLKDGIFSNPLKYLIFKCSLS